MNWRKIYGAAVTTVLFLAVVLPLSAALTLLLVITHELMYPIPPVRVKPEPAEFETIDSEPTELELESSACTDEPRDIQFTEFQRVQRPLPIHTWRTWTISGRPTRARLISDTSKMVWLRMMDGSIQPYHKSQLSEEDIKWLYSTKFLQNLTK